VQRLIPLYTGDRVIALRAYTEGISSKRGDTPFVELPRLGGPLLLRGYSRDRFRDRIAMLGTAEYQYPLARNVWAFFFVDSGRVFNTYSDVELADFRLGYGFGLQTHSQDAFQSRVHVASSTDGGLLFSLSFDPVFQVGARTERK
jgi:outer membrane translocation and assembly module TamA